MKVLWFSHIPLESQNRSYMGGNWIAALKEALLMHSDIELGICFHSQQPSAWKNVSDNVTIYNLSVKKNKLKRIFQKHLHHLTDNAIERYLEVIGDFKPDIIQIFGTESGFGSVAAHVEIPIVIHIQGILKSCMENWLPKGITLCDTLRYSGVRALILGNGNYHRWFLLRKQTVREQEIIQLNRYFFTRTHWDKKLIGGLNSQAKLLHCNEMLRPSFYTAEWSPKRSSGANPRFVSVMNGEIYK